jgi:hypothetical protein
MKNSEHDLAEMKCGERDLTKMKCGERDQINVKCGEHELHELCGKEDIMVVFIICSNYFCAFQLHVHTNTWQF